MQNLNIVILAAGKGTRMHSKTPKVLHKIGGKPILWHVLTAAKKHNPSKVIVVYGFGGEQVKASFKDETVIWAAQEEQLGTGHAVRQALPYLDEKAQTLILLGDVPLVSVEACQLLLEKAKDKLALLTYVKPDPTGYGRIVRNNGHVHAIVEHKDATAEEQAIQEVNTGIMAMPNHMLKSWLSQLSNNNAQKEYYLTDIVAMSVNEAVPVKAEITHDEFSVTGINNKSDLATIEKAYQLKQAEALLKIGVTLYDPCRIDIRGELSCGIDVEIDVNCVFEGKVTLGDGVVIGPNCVIKNATIHSGTKLAAFTHIEDAEVGGDSKIGPFARLRPGTNLAKKTHIGNFVELKNTQLGVGSKVNHLSYVGDSIVGENVNIGAGTITCNYDGANKFKTVIEDGAFIGSDTQLIAPVTVGTGATIAAGSTITKDAPANQLTVCRANKQLTIANWKRPVKKQK